MTTQSKILGAVIGALALAGLLMLAAPRVELELAPEPERAWVAIEVDAEGVARTGRVEIAAGTPFRLHAVLEARTWTGNTVYFTEAQELAVDGQVIPAAALRTWPVERQPRILWFSVEGFTPFLQVEDLRDLERFRFEEFFRPEWPRTWSIPGDLVPRRERALDPSQGAELPHFGTQRYHVRIEIFGPQSQITPQMRVRSLGAQDLPEAASRFPTVVAALPDRLKVASRVFGLTQIEPGAGSLEPIGERLISWSRQGIAFSRLTVLREVLEHARVSFRDLRWENVDLANGPMWGDQGLLAGDLLRVGDRWVIMLLDRGSEGILDRGDLCVDLDRGPSVRQVGEVFTGEGLVDWARLPDPESSVGS